MLKFFTFEVAKPPMDISSDGLAVTKTDIGSLADDVRPPSLVAKRKLELDPANENISQNVKASHIIVFYFIFWCQNTNMF